MIPKGPDDFAKDSQQAVDGAGLCAACALDPSRFDALGACKVHKQQLLVGDLTTRALRQVDVDEAVRARGARIEQVPLRDARQLPLPDQRDHLCRW